MRQVPRSAQRARSQSGRLGRKGRGFAPPACAARSATARSQPRRAPFRQVRGDQVCFGVEEDWPHWTGFLANEGKPASERLPLIRVFEELRAG